MPRTKNPENSTAREIVTDVLAWAHRAGCNNVAAALRRALELMPEDKPKQHSARQRRRSNR